MIPARIIVGLDRALEAGTLQPQAYFDQLALWHRSPEEWELDRVGEMGPEMYLHFLSDSLTRRVGDSIYNALMNSGKIPYTSAGISLIQALVQKELDDHRSLTDEIRTAQVFLGSSGAVEVNISLPEIRSISGTFEV